MFKPVLPQVWLKNKNKKAWFHNHLECLFLFFRPHHEAHGICVSQPGLEPRVPARGVESLNPWTAMQVPQNACLNANSCGFYS